MVIHNAKNWSIYSAWESISCALASFVCITFVMLLQGPGFYSVHPYKFYFFAATVFAYFFGYRLASTYVVLTTIFANLYFVPPFGIFTLTLDEFERFLINLLFGSVAIILIEILQRERYKSKLLLLVSNSRYLILLHRENRLLNEIKKNT
jgi:glycopeptide antibiotics resistance protein